MSSVESLEWIERRRESKLPCLSESVKKMQRMEGEGREGKLVIVSCD